MSPDSFRSLTFATVLLRSKRWKSSRCTSFECTIPCSITIEQFVPSQTKRILVILEIPISSVNNTHHASIRSSSHGDTGHEAIGELSLHKEREAYNARMRSQTFDRPDLLDTAFRPLQNASVITEGCACTSPQFMTVLPCLNWLSRADSGTGRSLGSWSNCGRHTRQGEPGLVRISRNRCLSSTALVCRHTWGEGNTNQVSVCLCRFKMLKVWPTSSLLRESCLPPLFCYNSGLSLLATA